MVPGIWPLQCSLEGSFRFAVEEGVSGRGLFIITQIPFTDLVTEYTLGNVPNSLLLGCGEAGMGLGAAFAGGKGLALTINLLTFAYMQD